MMMRNRILFFGVAMPLLAAGLMAASFPDPPKVTTPAAGKATAVLAGGCFWGMEGIYEHVKGVTDTTVGYAGGSKATAHYDMVSEGNTGHAESIKVTYDPTKITYGELLKIFFSGTRSDDAEPAALRCRPAVQVGDFLFRRRAEKNCRSVYSRSEQRESLQEPDRHAGRAAAGILHGRRAPPAFPRSQSDAGLYRGSGYSAAEGFPGKVPRVLQALRRPA